MRKLNSRDLVLLSLFIAIQIILTRFCGIQTPIVRLDFNFLAVSMCAAIFGPLWGGIAAAIADFLGVMLFPAVGAWFPGLTLSMFLMGFTYGFFLHNKEKSYFRITCAVLIVMIFISLMLDTYWISVITGKGVVALFPTRLVKCVIMIPLQIILIHLTWNAVGSRVAASSAIGRQKD